MRQVVIFRNNLFRVSEPFITGQAEALRAHAPLYAGRQRCGPAPAGATVLALQDGPGGGEGRGGGPAGWARAGWQMLSCSPDGMLRLLAPYRPVLIHAHFGTDAMYALPVARRLGIPLVTTFHGFDATLSRARMMASPAWMHFARRRALLAQQGALFLCVSGFIHGRVLAMGFPPERTHVQYIGVDCRRIVPREGAQARALVLHVARLVEMKGTRTLLLGFARLAAGRPWLRLEILGDGPLRGGLEKLAGALGISGQVRFLGAQPHAVALERLRQAAMLVLPSVLTASGRVEGLGMVLLEAAATGVPVVASDVGGIGDAVQDGQTGLLVPPRDPEALCRAMAVLLDDPELGARMGQAGREMVERRFDVARLTATLEARYVELAPPGPRSAGDGMVVGAA